jgi:hypothetical protein
MSSSGAAGGGAIQPSADCTGAFGAPELLFEDTTTVMGTPSLTSDELTMFYIDSDSTMAESEDRVVYRTRASLSAPFSAIVPVPELFDVCDNTVTLFSIHISRDGKRLYWVCTERESTTAAGELHMATRADAASPFQIARSTFGRVGRSISLSTDELTLVSNPTSGSSIGPEIFHRSTTDAAFGAPMPALDVHVSLGWPELGPDGLSLYGVLQEQNAYRQIAGARRSSTTASFTGVTNLGLPVASSDTTYAGPAFSADCRRMYWVAVRPMLPRAMYVARR